jgi:hypothetical protein
MKTKPQPQRIAELIESAKQQFGDFSEVKKREFFLNIKEAKIRDYCENSRPTDA